MYTSEVLAVVMQQLMEQSPLPMLLMRTVIQSLTMYPRLGGFVMNILSRLIMKQVTRPGPSRPPAVTGCSRTLKLDEAEPQAFPACLPLPPGSPDEESQLQGSYVRRGGAACWVGGC